MPLGVLLSLVAYGLYSCCDAIIKGFGAGDMTVHEIAFFASLFSLIPAIFTKPKGERWRSMFKLKHPWLVHIRGITGLLGNLCIIYAFVTIPLAEAYSLAFLAPIFVVLMSIVFLHERVSARRIVLLTASFVGVLLVVRPGFRELELGHLGALAAAFFGAVTTAVLRHVAPVEQRISLITIALGYIMVVNGVWMIPTFQMPTTEEFLLLLVIGAMGGTGNIVFIAATRRAQASQIAPAQYSQIFWAIALGAIFFNEMPDAIGYAGLAIVVATGILNVISEDTKIRIFSRPVQTGAGPATAAAEVSSPLTEESAAPTAEKAEA
jgi:drug/metabolite transporter (DMT)-like permease